MSTRVFYSNIQFFAMLTNTLFFSRELFYFKHRGDVSERKIGKFSTIFFIIYYLTLHQLAIVKFLLSRGI